ncbi:MAG TPA: 16S rRNA (adenine(1518)-N(6)/adenine(1519)-N(6))-dimethyltransferase RsmA, partial [Desulfurivibrionaceae bacterium]|nr:16S rRNA (adenine(1518)-N(6)/adenine(1519)-N(6))-dimethyltransferase RsmA [Desulfurivibrionaceae bacterium]
LHQRQLAASRQRGQNFLVHRRTAELIVEMAGVTPEDRVVELGVGFGALTGPLAARAAAVIGLEIDSGIIAWHQDEQDLPANVSLRHEDLLKADFPRLAEECGGRLKIVANLPYSISNPLLFKLLENRTIVDSAVLMLQKEVAQRLTAKPATKEYGILTVLLNGCARVEKLLDVGPGQFHPRPKVDSVVVKIYFFPQPERAAQLPTHDHELLKKLVKASFQQRRKTLLNSLSASGLPGTAKDTLPDLLKQAEVDPQVRPERLTVEDFVRIANLMDGLS